MYGPADAVIVGTGGMLNALKDCVRTPVSPVGNVTWSVTSYFPLSSGLNGKANGTATNPVGLANVRLDAVRYGMPSFVTAQS